MLTDMTGIFGGCSSLTNINVSSFDTSNVTYMTDIHGIGINNANANGDADEEGQPIITMADANAIVNMLLKGAQ